MVEIDPELATIARDYFGYRGSDRITEYFDDARRFVNQATSQYDVILVDAYGDGTIPFALTTLEYGQQIERLLADDGIVIANVIGGLLGGACQKVTEAVDAAYRAYLPNGYYTTERGEQEPRTNIITVYGRHKIDLPGLTAMPFAPGQAYLDNRAPTEQLYHQCRQETVDK